MHGLATLENNQLSDALDRLQRTDELIDSEADWPGKTVLKGLCMLLMGMVQTLQGNACVLSGGSGLGIFCRTVVLRPSLRRSLGVSRAPLVRTTLVTDECQHSTATVPVQDQRSAAQHL